MATPETAPKPAPKPPEPAPDHAARGREHIASIKAGFDPLRPLRYASLFINGTMNDGLNGIAQWGRKGAKYGLWVGVVAAIALQGVAPLLLCAGGLFAAGALVGGAHGFATGGVRAVARQRRGEIYADDLVVREKQQKAAPASRTDFRRRYQEQQREAHQYDTLQYLTRRDEWQQDNKTYWQDREANHASGRGGLGF